MVDWKGCFAVDFCIIGCMVDWNCFGCTVYSAEIVDIGGYGTQFGFFSEYETFAA